MTTYVKYENAQESLLAGKELIAEEGASIWSATFSFTRNGWGESDVSTLTNFAQETRAEKYENTSGKPFCSAVVVATSDREGTRRTGAVGVGTSGTNVETQYLRATAYVQNGYLTVTLRPPVTHGELVAHASAQTNEQGALAGTIRVTTMHGQRVEEKSQGSWEALKSAVNDALKGER